jgi:hypothetical protein
MGEEAFWASSFSKTENGGGGFLGKLIFKDRKWGRRLFRQAHFQRPKMGEEVI